MTNHIFPKAVAFLLLSILMSVASIAHPAIVIIDPGHGGIDRGGIPGQSLAEKVFTLDTGKRLAKILQSNGDIKVVMTRETTRSFRCGKNISRTSTGGETRPIVSIAAFGSVGTEFCEKIVYQPS